MEIELASFASEAEAEVAASLLRSHGINCRVTALAPLGISAGASLRVRSGDVPSATELLRAVPSSPASTGIESPTSPPVPAAEVLTGLARIRRRRRLLWIVVFSYLPLMGGAMILASSDTLAQRIAMLWMLLLVAAGFAIQFSRCPRCSRFFHWGRFYGNTFARRCLHCHQELRPRRGAA